MKSDLHTARSSRWRHVGRRGVLALVAVLALGAPAAPALGDAGAHTAPTCTAASIKAALNLPNVTVISAHPVTGGSYTPLGTTTPITGLPSFCDAELTDADSAGNAMRITVWLPAHWNGRFEGVGGGGYSCGVIFTELATAVQSGYASASTDCGNTQSDGSFALTRSGQLNWPLIKDFASAGIHDMSVVAKAPAS